MQITLEGKTKDLVAIERIHEYAKLSDLPLYIASSFGKDSEVATHLVIRSGVPYEIHNQVTGIDPPELVYFGRKYHPEAIRHYPKESIWKLIERKGLPTRRNRWCCQLLKETGGIGRFVITGIRHEESARRAKRPMIEIRKRKSFLHPIIDWTLLDVWSYIETNNLPYCSLYDTSFDRLGCIGCPLSSNQSYEFKIYPKIAEAWHRATLRCFEKRKDLHTISRFKDGEQMWRWWLSGKRIDHFTGENMVQMDLSNEIAAKRCSQEVMELGV